MPPVSSSPSMKYTTSVLKLFVMVNEMRRESFGERPANVTRTSPLDCASHKVTAARAITTTVIRILVLRFTFRTFPVGCLGLLPKSIWKDEFHESLLLSRVFQKEMGTHGARPSNESGF